MPISFKTIFVSSLVLPAVVSCTPRTPQKPVSDKPVVIQKQIKNKSPNPFSCSTSKSAEGKETVFSYKNYYLGTTTQVGLHDNCEPLAQASNQAYAQGTETNTEGTLSIEVDKPGQSLKLSYNNGEAVLVDLNSVVQPEFQYKNNAIERIFAFRAHNSSIGKKQIEFQYTPPLESLDDDSEQPGRTLTVKLRLPKKDYKKTFNGSSSSKTNKQRP